MSSATLDRSLTTNPRLQIQGELFAADCFRRPPSMPQFRDEPEMPKEPPKIHKPDKPLPFYHWSKWQSLIDARVMRALADEGQLSEKQVEQMRRGTERQREGG